MIYRTLIWLMIMIAVIVVYATSSRGEFYEDILITIVAASSFLAGRSSKLQEEQ